MFFFLLIFQPFIGSHYRVYIRVKRHSKMSVMLNVKTTKFFDFSHITCILHACTNDVSNTLHNKYWTKSVESTKQSIKSSIEFVYRIVLLLINFWQLSFFQERMKSNLTFSLSWYEFRMMESYSQSFITVLFNCNFSLWVSTTIAASRYTVVLHEKGNFVTLFPSHNDCNFLLKKLHFDEMNSYRLVMFWSLMVSRDLRSSMLQCIDVSLQEHFRGQLVTVMR